MTPSSTARKQPGARPVLRFVVPTYGRFRTTGVCLRQLGRTCRTLQDAGLDAGAVVVGNDENLMEAEKQDFTTIVQENRPLGRKWNDAYQQAAREGADFFVPIGSDDWVDPDIFTRLPEDPREIVCFRRCGMVNPDGSRLALLDIPYRGGIGIRVFTREMLSQLEFRPAIERKERAIDTAVLRRLSAPSKMQPKVVYADRHDKQIVDWKDPRGPQLNTYEACVPYFQEEIEDPFDALRGFSPPEALAEMYAVYHEEVAA